MWRSRDHDDRAPTCHLQNSSVDWLKLAFSVNEEGLNRLTTVAKEEVEIADHGVSILHFLFHHIFFTISTPDIHIIPSPILDSTILISIRYSILSISLSTLPANKYLCKAQKTNPNQTFPQTPSHPAPPIMHPFPVILILLSSLLLLTTATALPAMDSQPHSGVSIRIYKGSKPHCNGYWKGQQHWSNLQYRLSYDTSGTDAKNFKLGRDLKPNESLQFYRKGEGSAYYTVKGKDAKKGCNHLPSGKAADSFQLMG